MESILAKMDELKAKFEETHKNSPISLLQTSTADISDDEDLANPDDDEEVRFMEDFEPSRFNDSHKKMHLLDREKRQEANFMSHLKKTHHHEHHKHHHQEA